MKKKYLVTTVAMLAAVSMLTACGNGANTETPDTTITVTPSEEATPGDRGEGPELPEAGEAHAQMVQKIYQAVYEIYGTGYISNSMQVQGESIIMQDRLGLDASWYDSAIVEMPMLSDSVEMFAIVHATEGNVENVKNAFDNYKNMLVDDANQYVENLPKVQSIAVEVLNDEYVIYSLLTGLAWTEDITEESELIAAYEESSRTAVDVAAAVVAGEYEVELWTEIDLIRNAIVATYGENYWANTKVHANPEELAMRMADLLKMDAAWVDEIVYEIPMINVNIDTLLLVKPSDGNTEKVMTALTEYKNMLVNDSRQYPQNAPRVNSAVVQQVGDYACFIILGGVIDNWEAYDNATLIEMYEQHNMMAIDAMKSYLGIWE